MSRDPEQLRAGSRFSSADLELIAAFIDGRLEGAERAEVVARLASDERWFELYSESLELAEGAVASGRAGAGEGAGVASGVVPGVVPWPKTPEVSSETTVEESAESWTAAADRPAARRTGSVRWWLLAAAVVFVSVSGWLFFGQRGAPTSDRLVASLLAGEALQQRLGADWSLNDWSGMRGLGPSLVAGPTGAFRLGVLSVRLATARRAGDQRALQSLLLFAESELEGIEGAGNEAMTVEIWRRAIAAGEQDEGYWELLEESLRKNIEPRNRFEMGRWAASSLIVLQAGDANVLRSARFRKGLAGMERVTGPPEVLAAVAVLEELSSKKERDAEETRVSSSAALRVILQNGGNGAIR